MWLYRDDVVVAAFRCAEASLIDALDLVLNAVPTYVADAVALAFEGPPYQGPGDRSANAIHVVRRQRDGRWHVGCLPYTVEWSDAWRKRAPRRLGGRAAAGRLQLRFHGRRAGVAGSRRRRVEEAFARAPLVTEEMLVQLQEELDMDALATRHRADLDVTHALVAFGRGRWCIDPEEAAAPVGGLSLGHVEPSAWRRRASRVVSPTDVPLRPARARARASAPSRRTPG